MQMPDTDFDIFSDCECPNNDKAIPYLVEFSKQGLAELENSECTTNDKQLDRALLLAARIVGHPWVSELHHPKFPLKTYLGEQPGIQLHILQGLMRELEKIGQLDKDDRQANALRLCELAPNLRVALHLAATEHLLEGDQDAALECARKSLARSGECPFAQQIMYQAYKAKQAENPTYVPNDISMLDLSDRFCSKPFDTFVTAEGGAVLTCNCGGWLPFPIGNVYNADTSEEVWNSDAAAEIRRSILDGDFSYCSRMLCPYIVGDTLQKKSEVKDKRLRQHIDRREVRLPPDCGPRGGTLSHDASCNLACPSCRTEVIVAKKSERGTYDKACDDIILPIMRKMDGMLTICGHGDPFGSWHYRSILDKVNPENYPKLRLDLLTNGILLTEKEWNRQKGLHALVDFIRVSIDAASAEVYEDVRRPAKWDVLMENLQFIGELRKQEKIKYFQTSMVVQQKNYGEMVDFIKMSRAVNADQIMFIRLWNFAASFNEKELIDADVCSENHPEHEELLEVLRDPIFTKKYVSLFNLENLATNARSAA